MKKYTQSYSQLSKIILKMSEDQQTVLLKIAQKILSGKKDNDPNFQKLNSYWLISIGVFSGWVFAATVLITFFKTF